MPLTLYGTGSVSQRCLRDVSFSSPCRGWPARVESEAGVFGVGGDGHHGGHVLDRAAPRRICPHCKRDIAVVSGRFARHDPIDRGPILLSCHGSLQQAPIWDLPDRSGTRSLLDLLAEQDEGQADEMDVAEAQEALFPALPGGR